MNYSECAQYMATRPALSSSSLIKMSPAEFEELTAYICEKTGVAFRENKKYLLESRLAPRLQELGCRSYSDYIQLLKNEQGQTEFLKLASSITINETSFMRNLPQLMVFKDQILPELAAQLQRGERHNVRIWSAGCSSGEEPYTLAMLACESQAFSPFLRKIEIFATDIDQEILEVARTGVYRQSSLRNTPANLRMKYFKQSAGGYIITQKIKSVVRFSNLNLVDYTRLKLLRNIDIIFFRNVMIYFDQNARKRIIAHMYDALREGGFLFLGHSESLHGISKAFRLVSYGNSMVYKKE